MEVFATKYTYAKHIGLTLISNTIYPKRSGYREVILTSRFTLRDVEEAHVED